MSNRLIIRAAIPRERQALEDLQRRASLIWEEYRADLLAHPEAIELPANQIVDGCVCVAEEAAGILGFSVVLPREDGDAELDGLFVEPSAWRKGIGRALVDDAMRRAGLGGARAMHVIANPLAEAFYRACGFVYSGEAKTQFGTACTMRRALESGAAAV
jgi:GNAT superfamily N-acetyltransferase